MDVIRRRFRLYLRYKSQEVDQIEICVRPEWSNAKNYKALYSMHLRLGRCLAARKKVYELYADDDPGHAFAIAFVEKQMAEVDGLLQTICHQMQSRPSKEGAESEKEEDADAESADPDPEGTKGRMGTKGTMSVTDQLRDLQKESVKEVDALAEMESISQDKMLDTVSRIYNVIKDDPEVTDNLRHLMKSNMETSVNMHALFLAFTMLAFRVDAVNTNASKPQCNRYLFYHLNLSDTAIRTSLLRFQQEQLVSKSELTNHLQQTYTHAAAKVGDRKSFIGFGLRLFCDLFDGAGQFTTRSSVFCVVTLTITTGILAHAVEHLQSSVYDQIDVVCRRRLLKIYDADVVDQMERAVHILLFRYDPTLRHKMERVPWAFLFRTPDYITALHMVWEQILHDEKKLIYIF